MKRKNIVNKALLIFFICFLGLTGCSLLDLFAPQGTVLIESVTPNSNLQDGVTYSFTVVVSYTLISGQGEVSISFNDGDSVSSYTILDDKIVDSGEGSETFIVEAVAKDWGSEGDFKVYADISESPHSASWSPLDSNKMILSF